jgi:conjugal transfer/entry exclusion protein
MNPLENLGSVSNTSLNQLRNSTSRLLTLQNLGQLKDKFEGEEEHLLEIYK